MWSGVFIIGFLSMVIFMVMGIVGAVKKNGTVKKRFLWALISFIAFVVGAANMPSTETQPTTSGVESSSVKKTEDNVQKEADAKTKKEEAVKDKAETEATATAEAEATAPRIGDTVKVGNFLVAITEPKQSDVIGDEYLNQKAKGVYWIFAVAVRNDDKEARTVDSSMFEIISNSGVKYEPDSTADIYVNKDSNFFLEKINPGIVLKGYLVFDMPQGQNISDYKMQVRGGIGFKTTKPVDILLKSKQ